jgi:hypothetical protein
MDQNREILEGLTRKQAIDFLSKCGVRDDRLKRMSDDTLATVYDIFRERFAGGWV